MINPKKKTAVLTPEQEEAAAFDKGRALVIAVAGSGKTQMLLHRVSRLLNKDGVDPERILVLMFNTNAAEDFNARLAELGIDNFAAGTFHAFAKMLVEAYENRDVPQGDVWVPLHLLETEEQYAEYIGTVLTDYNRTVEERLRIKEDTSSRNQIKTFIEGMKNNDYPYGPKIPEREVSRLAGAYRRVEPSFAFLEFYEKRRKQDAVYSFTDLLYRLRELMTEDEEFAEQLSTWYDYVMVDEYQDSNPVQHFIVKALKAPSLMMVGDDDQSIYSFRGAKPDYITLGLFDDYEDAEVFKLSRTFRYGPVVSMMSNALIGRNIGRSDKFCISAHGTPDTRVSVLPSASGLAYVSENLSELEGYKVLVRTNAEVDAINFLLWEKGLCGQHVDAETGIWSRSEETAFVYDIVHAAVDGCEHMSRKSMHYLIKTAGRNAFSYLSPERLEKFLQSAVSFSAKNTVAVLGRSTEYTDLKVALRSMYLFLNNLPKFKDAKVGDLLLYANQVFPNIRPGDFLKTVYKSAAGQSLSDFRRKMSEGLKVCDLEVMTVHATKGATFEKVLIPHLREHVFPSFFTETLTEEKAEEERRLFYVALTRCSKELRITYPDVPAFTRALMTNDAAAASVFSDLEGAPSRFVFEMEPVLALCAGNEVRHGHLRREPLPYTTPSFLRYREETAKLGPAPEKEENRSDLVLVGDIHTAPKVALSDGDTGDTHKPDAGQNVARTASRRRRGAEDLDDAYYGVGAADVIPPAPSPAEQETIAKTGGAHTQDAARLDDLTTKLGSVYARRIQAARSLYDDLDSEAHTV